MAVITEPCGRVIVQELEGKNTGDRQKRGPGVTVSVAAQPCCPSISRAVQQGDRQACGNLVVGQTLSLSQG